MSVPRCSVVMACHDAAAHVEEAVASVRRQTRGDWELIAVDDGSRDATPEILARLAAEDPARIRVLRQENRGPYPARNLGLAHARGETVAFLDADDWWEPRFLERMLGELEASGADLVYCGWRNVGRPEAECRPYVPPAYEEEDAAWHFVRSCPWPIHAVVVRRSCVEAVGRFSEWAFAAMDYDLWLKLLGHGVRMRRVPEVLAVYRWHGSGQISRRLARQSLIALEAKRRFIERHPDRVAHLGRAELEEALYFALRRQARRAWWARQVDDAAVLYRRLIRHRQLQRRDWKPALLSCLPLPLLRLAIGARDTWGG